MSQHFFPFNNYFIYILECPKSTSNMAWIDAHAVKLGCVGFSKTKSYRSSRYGRYTLAKDVCKKANSNAHLIEIFNDNQSKFLKSEKVRKQVRTQIGIDTYTCYHGSGFWWIGAELKSGDWYWQHSNKRVTYWSKIGGSQYSKSNRYVMMWISRTKWL